MEEPLTNGEQFVQRLLEKEYFILLLGKRSSSEEHTNANKIMKNPTIWKFTGMIARQSVDDIYRLPELDSEYTKPGFMDLIQALTFANKKVYVISDVIDGFFERCQLQNLEYFNLCGSVEEMYRWSKSRNPPDSWHNRLTRGVDSQIAENTRMLIQKANQTSFVFCIGTEENPNFGVLTSAIPKSAEKISFEKTRTQCREDIQQITGDLDSILSGLAASIMMKQNNSF